MAISGAAASEGTRRNSYALAAMAGRLPGVAQVGEVAAAMGWLDTDSTIFSGLTAGERSTQSWRSMRFQVRRDDARFSAERAARVERTAGTPSTASAEPAELDVNHLDGEARRLLLAVDLVQMRQDPTLRASAMHLEKQHVVYTEPESAPALAAMHAVTVPRGEANIPRLLLEGYRVQENVKEATISYWKPGTPAAQPPAEQQTASPAPQVQAAPTERSAPASDATKTPVASSHVSTPASDPSASAASPAEGRAVAASPRASVPAPDATPSVAPPSAAKTPAPTPAESPKPDEGEHQ
jgi:hypothetical protein